MKARGGEERSKKKEKRSNETKIGKKMKKNVKNKQN